YVRNLAARALRVPPAVIDDDQPLVELGLDSLAAAELLGQLQLARAAPGLTFEELLGTATVRRLAAALASGAPPARAPAAAAPPPGGLAAAARRRGALKGRAPGTNTTPSAVATDGGRDPARLRPPPARLPARHEALHTAFRRAGAELAAEVVRPVSLAPAAED